MFSLGSFIVIFGGDNYLPLAVKLSVGVVSDPKSSLEFPVSQYAGNLTFIVKAHKLIKMTHVRPRRTKIMPKAFSGL